MNLFEILIPPPIVRSQKFPEIVVTKLSINFLTDIERTLHDAMDYAV